MSKVNAVSLAACAITLCTAVPAQAQFKGLFDGVVSATNQVTSKLGSKVMGDDQPVNLEEERNKLYAGIQQQTAGMDETTRRMMMSTVDSKWPMIEASFLMRNAQAYRAKTAPWLDLKKVAQDAMGGVMLHSDIGRVALGDTGLDGVLKGAAMDGIVSGAGVRATGSAASNVRRADSMSSSLLSGATAPVSGVVSSAVSGVISSGMRSMSGAAENQVTGPEYKINESNHPLAFFEKHPEELTAKDLYRLNGNIGWKQIEASKTAAAFVPVAGDDFAKVSVFNIEPASGRVSAAFRILSVEPQDFLRVVMGVSKQLNLQPRYASQGGIMRAVWENGAFVAADAAKVSAGWSALVPATYRAAQQAVAAK